MLQALESMKFFIDLCRCAQLRPTVCSPMVEACQARLSMEFSRQEYWSRLLVPAPGDLPNPGTKPASPALTGRSSTTESPEKPLTMDDVPHFLLDISPLFKLGYNWFTMLC